MSAPVVTPKVPGEQEFEEAVAPADTAEPRKPRRTKAEPKETRQEDGLPHQSTIDASKIKRAVLSSEGWVCPKPPEKAEK